MTGSALDRLFSVQGKTALVTGGTSGIGRMIAEGLLLGGAKTYIASRDEASCAAVSAELSSLGDCIGVPANLNAHEGCLELASEMSARESSVDILVNAAGIQWGAPLEDYPDAAWDKLFQLNVKSVFQLTVALLPLLKKSASLDNPSRVINVGSVHGYRTPRWDTYAYSSSKAAVHQLTRHLAKRLGPSNITVNAIAPGPFPSRMMESTLPELEDEFVRESAIARIGRTDDMAGLALYLSSRAGSFITGVVLPVDGGYGSLA